MTTTHIAEEHFVDELGRPAGGKTTGTGIEIAWQNGPLCVDGVRREPNGAFVEGILEAAVGRLRFYQSSEFRSPYNARALAHLELALRALHERTADREARGVEGTHRL